MIQKTIAEIEAKIRAEISSDERKRELLQLLAKLKTEISEQHKPLKHSVEELRSSVKGFEQSHPKLVQTVNSISNTLASWGI